MLDVNIAALGNLPGAVAGLRNIYAKILLIRAVNLSAWVWPMVVIGIADRNSAEINNLIVWPLEFGVKIVG